MELGSYSIHLGEQRSTSTLTYTQDCQYTEAYPQTQSLCPRCFPVLTRFAPATVFWYLSVLENSLLIGRMVIPTSPISYIVLRISFMRHPRPICLPPGISIDPVECRSRSSGKPIPHAALLASYVPMSRRYVVPSIWSTRVSSPSV